MTRQNRIIINFFSLSLNSIVSILLSIILSISIARFLGVNLFGRYSYLIVFISFFSFFLDIGYETLLIREVAKDKIKASYFIENVLGLRIILGIVFLIGLSFFMNFLQLTYEVQILFYIFSFYQILISLSNVFKVTFRAFERMGNEAKITIVSTCIRSFLGILVLFIGFSLNEIALVFIVSALIDLILSYVVCHTKFAKVKIGFHRPFFKNTIKKAFPIGLIAFFGLIYVKIDTLMLASLNGETVVGWYNAAYNLILGFRPLPQLFMSALLPFMSYSVVHSFQSVRQSYEKSFKILLLLGLPASIGIFLLADQLIMQFYGLAYENSVVVLKILSWDIILKFLYLCIWFVLITVDKQKELAVAAGSSALLNVVLNYLLIPQYSYVGAAVTTILTESFLLALFLYISYRIDFRIGIIKLSIKPIFACIPMSLFIIFFKDLNLLILIFFSMCLYFVILFLIHGFSQDEIAIFKKFLQRK